MGLYLHRHTVLDFPCPLQSVASSLLWEVKTEPLPKKRTVQVGTAFSAGFLTSQRSQTSWPGLCASGAAPSMCSVGMSWASHISAKPQAWSDCIQYCLVQMLLEFQESWLLWKPNTWQSGSESPLCCRVELILMWNIPKQ